MPEPDDGICCETGKNASISWPTDAASKKPFNIKDVLTIKAACRMSSKKPEGYLFLKSFYIE